MSSSDRSSSAGSLDATNLAFWIGALRGAPSEIERRLARNELAKVVRGVCMRTLARRTDFAAVADDVANTLTCKLVDVFETGSVPGNPAAYVMASARNGALTHLRQQSGMRARSFSDDDDTLVRDSPEDDVLALEHAREEDSRAARLRAAVASIPPAQRELVEDVYYRGRAIGDVVRAEADRRGVDPSDAVGQARVRDQVDKQLQRVRERLRVSVGQTPSRSASPVEARKRR